MASNQSPRSSFGSKHFQKALRAGIGRARRALNRPTNQSSITPSTGSPPTMTPSVNLPAHPPNKPAVPVSQNFHRFKSTAWNGLETALHMLETSTEVFPALSSAVAQVISCLDVVETAVTNREYDYELATELATTANAVRQYIVNLPLGSHEGALGNIIQLSKSIEAEVSSIEKKRRRSKRTQAFMQIRNREDTIRHYRNIKTLFQQLQTNIALQVLQNTASTNNQALAMLLRSMSPADDARYASSYATFVKRRECTANTRERVREALQSWAQDPSSAKVYWMNGMAGTGKTTIAYSLCKWLEGCNRLGASFFCSRSSPPCRDVNRILPTIAYQLAGYLPDYREILCNVLGQDPDASKSDLVRQFEKLVLAPLQRIKSFVPAGVVVVIDALDECADVDGVRLFLETVLCLSTDLPVKFFFTSRPEPAIRNTIILFENYSPSIFYLHDIDRPTVEDDIKKYFAEELASLSPSLSWPQIEQLACHAGGLFIYAATVVRYVLPGTTPVDSETRLRNILAMDFSTKSGSNKRHKELDALYTIILAAAFNRDVLEDEELGTMQLVLRTAVCVKEPVHVKTLAALLDLSENQVLVGLEPLRSVLHVSQNEEFVSTLHASFADYMFDASRSEDFYCHEAQHNELLTLRCFETLKKQLRFNICNLESSFVLDKDVVDLERKIEVYISSTLLYACRYWGEHLHQSGNSYALHNELLDFLSHRLLFWMEVLNLSQSIVAGISILAQAEDWLLNDQTTDEARKLTTDAKDFLIRFAASACTLSTPHIYISALPFCSRSGLVYRCYWKRTQGLVDARGTVLDQREKAAQATWMLASPVIAVAVSPDGGRVAVLSRKRVFQVKDVYTSATLFTVPIHPLNSIISFAFSPDGTRIILGTDNDGIELYDAHTGQSIPGSAKKHSSQFIKRQESSAEDGWSSDEAPHPHSDRMIGVGEVQFGSHPHNRRSISSVAFSPDGRRMASSCSDGTIRVWDAHTNAISELLRDRSSINSISFSPDSIFLVSGSDSDISLWNIHVGVRVNVLFEGHKGAIKSVVFSPNGSLIASGSQDQTIRVWDSSTGEMRAGPFIGHTGSINAIAFYPDGLRIASGSTDRTIRVWDIVTGRSVAGTLDGHTDSIYSIVLSPDGTRLISGSRDRTVRLWDARLSNITGASLRSHTDVIYAVAFSPDGTRIASGSRDRTIRVWDVLTGNSVAKPFQGHKDSVYTVTFSPRGDSIASGSRDGTVHVWRVVNGSVIAILSGSQESSVTSVCFSPDSSRIVACSGGRTILVWDIHTGNEVMKPFKCPSRSLNSVRFSPCGSLIISASCRGDIYVWCANSGNRMSGPLQGHRGLGSPPGSLSSISSFRSLRLSPKSRQAVSPPTKSPIYPSHLISRTSSNGSAHSANSANSANSVNSTRSLRSMYSLRSAPSIELIPQPVLPTSSMSDSPRPLDRQLPAKRPKHGAPASGSPVARIARSLQSRRSMKSLRSISSINACIAIFSPDGQRIVHISDQLMIHVWDSQTGDTITGPLGGLEGQAWSLGISSDGTRIATGMHDNTIKVWDGATGVLTAGPFGGHMGPINSIAFSPDGTRFVSGSSDRTIRVWRSHSRDSYNNPVARKVNEANGGNALVGISFGAEESAARQGHVENPFLGAEELMPNEDGWIMTKTGLLVLWVSPDLRDHMPYPHNSLVIGPQGSFHIDYANLLLGEGWSKCYKLLG